MEQTVWWETVVANNWANYELGPEQTHFETILHNKSAFLVKTLYVTSNIQSKCFIQETSC